MGVDLSQLVISIRTVGKEEAVKSIDEVKAAGTKAASSPIKFKFDTTSADKAIAVMKELKAAGATSAGAFTVKVGSASEALAATQQIKTAMTQIGGAAHSVNVIYDEGAVALQKQKEAAKQAAAEQKIQQQVIKQTAAKQREQEKAVKVAAKQAAAEQKAQEKAQKETAKAIAQQVKEQKKKDVAAAKAAAAAERSAKRHADELARQKGTIRELNDHFLRMARIVSSAAVAFYLFRTVTNVFKDLLDTVDEFNTSTIGIASTMTDMAKDQSNPQQNFIQNLSYARDMYVELENAAAKFYASGQELIQAWSIMTQQGVVLQHQQIDNLGVIVDKIKLLTQGQVGSVQIAQELRAALMGQARPTDQLARIVKDRLGGAWKEVFKEIRQTQSLEPLAKLFSGLEIARPFIQETMMSQLTTLWTNLRQAARVGMTDPYKDVVNYLKQWNDWLRENKEYVGTSLKSAWETIKTVLSAIEGVLSRIKSLLQDPIMMAGLGAVVGGMRGGYFGAVIGAVGGAAASENLFGGTAEKSFGSSPNAEIENVRLQLYRDKLEQLNREIGTFYEFTQKDIGKSWIDLRGGELVEEWGRYKKAVREARIEAEKFSKEQVLPSSNLPSIPTGMGATPLAQRPITWSDDAIKALQTANNLVVELNRQFSSISENSMSRIIADMAKMNNQIDKTIYKMKDQLDSQRMAVVYEQKLKSIRDQIIAQELEKRNRDIYAYSLEGVADTLENQYAKIALAQDDFKRKFLTPAPKSDLEELYGDPILRIVEGAKNAEEVMKSSAENWGEAWKKQLAEVSDSLDKMIGKLQNLGAVPPTGYDYLKKYMEGAGGITGLFSKLDFGALPAIGGGAAPGSSLPPGTIIVPPERSKSGRSFDWNNPGNLTGNYQGIPGNPWPYQARHGAVANETGKFVSFPSPEAGYEALIDQIEIYKSKNMTLAKMVETYAPRSENKDVDQYISMLAAKLGVSPETSIAGLPRDDLARWIIWKESQSKIAGQFQGMQSVATGNMQNMLGGQTVTEMWSKKGMFQFDNATLNNYMKLQEALKGAYSALTSMSMPADEINKYSQKALDLELMINQAKTEQFILSNGLSGDKANEFRQLNLILESEKKKAEAINSQIRPLEEQKELLSQQQKLLDDIASSSLFMSDQLEYERQSLVFRQQIAQIELREWIIKNEERLKLSQSQKETLQNLLQQQQINENIAQIRKGWQTQGITGGVKEFATQQVIDSQTYLAKSTTQFLSDIKTMMTDELASVWIEFADSGSLSFTQLAESFRNRFINLAMDLIVNQLWTALSQVLMQSMKILGSVGGGSPNLSGFNWDAMYSTGAYSHGGVFSNGRLVPFRRGGVVDKPHVFPFASGVGLMGEAGAEGILPLTRLPNGDLGVKSSGSSEGQENRVPNIIINNYSKNAEPTKMEQDQNGDWILTIEDWMTQAYGRRGKFFKMVNQGNKVTRR